MRPSNEVGVDDLVIDGTSIDGFDELYVEYSPRVRGLIRRLIADRDLAADVLQETFLRAFQSDLHHESGEDQWPWLATVARNLCLDALRKRSRVSERDQFDDVVQTVQLPEAQGDPEWHFIARGRREGIAEALASVSPRCRRILLRKHLDGWAYDEIAQSEGMSVDAVKSALARARRSFRESYTAIAEHRGLGASVGGFLAGLRVRFQTARHRLADRLSASAQYFPNPAAFSDAFAAAVVAGAVAVSAGMAGGAVPSVPLDEPNVVRQVEQAPAPSGEGGSGSTADSDDAPAPLPAQSTPVPPAASTPSEPPAAPEPQQPAPKFQVTPPDPNKNVSFDSDDHVPAEDPPAGGLLDLGVLHEDDGNTRVENDADAVVGDDEYNIAEGHAGVDCAQHQRDASTTMTVACAGLDQV
jgi:RNA polymerase sigma-70 factor (ECF subfamily)